MAPPGFAAQANVDGTMLSMVFEAAFKGDLPLLKSLVTKLDNGRGHLKEAIESLRVEHAGEMDGLGVLHVAASRGRLEVCRYLVEELRVDVDGVDKRGRTPLLYLTMFSKDVARVPTAKYLLDHGANRDKASYDGYSPLHYAAGTGDCDMVELLLAKGANVDPIAPVGTPLHFAANKGQYATMQILLDHNADYNKMVNGKTPVFAAIDGGSMECINLLIKAGADGKGALTYAAENLVSSNLISKDTVDCMLEDVTTYHDVRDGDEQVSTKKISAAGFKKLGSHCFKLKDYFTAARHYSLDYEGASERFLDGLKLDPQNSEMENALREAMEFLKTSGNTKAK